MEKSQLDTLGFPASTRKQDKKIRAIRVELSDVVV